MGGLLGGWKKKVCFSENQQHGDTAPHVCLCFNIWGTVQSIAAAAFGPNVL